MNIFFAPPSQMNNGFAELTGQEAIHASKVMRVREGDRMVVVDGRGGRYRGIVRRILDETVQVEIEDSDQQAEPRPALILGMGIIKKRDRLEFAVEKAVELGARQICLFRSEHTIKENVRMDRLESIAVSAMKQSLRAWLPKISLYHSFEELLEGFPEATYLAAHEKVEVDSRHKDFKVDPKNSKQLLLLVGPEGGFAPREIAEVESRDGRLVSLGTHRLRAETAAVVFLSQFI